MQNRKKYPFWFTMYDTATREIIVSTCKACRINPDSIKQIYENYVPQFRRIDSTEEMLVLKGKENGNKYRIFILYDRASIPVDYYIGKKKQKSFTLR